MRNLGIVLLVVVCLLVTTPVLAADGYGERGWWDVVVEWMAQVVGAWTTGPASEPNGGDLSTIGGDLEPNGLGPSEGPNVPNGLEGDTGPSMEPNG
jgi:hypothetical protein